MDPLLKPILESAQFKLGTQLCVVFLIIFWLATVFWTWRDADRRGAMPWFWATVVFLFFPLVPLPGWAVYMVMRPPEYAEDVRERQLEIRARESELARDGATCPSCLKPVEPDFLICPYCMRKLRKQCPSCGKALKTSWAVCPYCRTKQPAAPTSPAKQTATASPAKQSASPSAPKQPPPASAAGTTAKQT
jgi:hypothetical protein